MLAELRQKKMDGFNIDEAIKWLHEQGASKVESIANIHEVYDIKLSEAKDKVHNHKVWNFRKDADNDFHEKLFHNLNNK
jgi:ribosomal protein L7/L12